MTLRITGLLLKRPTPRTAIRPGSVFAIAVRAPTATSEHRV